MAVLTSYIDVEQFGLLKRTPTVFGKTKSDYLIRIWDIFDGCVKISVLIKFFAQEVPKVQSYHFFLFDFYYWPCIKNNCDSRSLNI